MKEALADEICQEWIKNDEISSKSVRCANVNFYFVFQFESFQCYT